MATDGQLQAELLSVYRELSRLYKNRDALLDQAVKVQDDLERERANNLKLEAKLTSSRNFWYEVDEKNAQLTIRNNVLEEALFAAIDDALDLEHFSQFVSVPVTTEAKKFVDVVPGVMPSERRSDPRDPVMPLLCLSCGAQKSGFYLCEECFEIDLDHSCSVFEELQDAWDKGDRDFPRTGKNIKVLYAKA